MSVITTASTGHLMEYRVLGEDGEGYPILSQWDAQHSGDCQCEQRDPDERYDW
ncbi:hypothetical protein ACIBEA_41885 [Streptomyces sp. NPDC051555]|uniref:hypothetical protein n=1 Tax=Streptomyces sp. NPDC051555 TaxID=3365657 RepID=UPI0037A2B083